MNKTYKQCRSCGMPLKKDKNGGGSEKDGTLSKMYCSSCYQDGVFKDKNITLEDMQKLVDDVLTNEVKLPKIFRWLAVRQIPKLVRWKKN
ncbi:zinc ribbon domain-containing protein [Candidatus Parcubacteria bacterium]|nr:zinc ribbon domain-containing protein [Candidatus Parcubacteria bacterium]